MDTVTGEIEKQKHEYEQAKAHLDVELKRVSARIKSEEANAAAKQAQIEMAVTELNAGKELAERALKGLRAEGETAQRQIAEARKSREEALAKARREAELLEYNIKHREAAERDFRLAEAALNDVRDRATAKEQQLVEAANKIAALEAKASEVEAARQAIEAAATRLKGEIVDLEEKRVLVVKATEDRVRAAAEGEARVAAVRAEIQRAEADLGVQRAEAVRTAESARRALAEELELARRQVLDEARAAARILESEAEGKAGALMVSAESRATALVAEAKSLADSIVADAAAKRNAVQAEIQDLKASATEEVASARRQAADDAKRVRQKASELSAQKVEAANADATRLVGEAEARAKQELSEAAQAVQDMKRGAEEAKRVADELRATVESEFQRRVALGEADAKKMREEAVAETDALRARVRADYDAEIEKGRKQSQEILESAKAKAKKLKDATQQDYDAKLADAEATFQAKVADGETRASRHVQETEARMAASAEAAAREIERLAVESSERLAKATSDAKRLVGAAEDQAKLLRDEAERYKLEIVHRADQEFADKHQRLVADVTAKREQTTAELREWLGQEKRKAKALRKKQAEDAAAIVRKFVEVRATKFMVEAKSPFEVADLADESEKAVRELLLDDGTSERDKIMKYVADDGGAKIKAMLQRRKMVKLAAIVAGSVVLVTTLSIGAYRYISTAKDRKDSGSLYADKILNSRKTERMYLAEQSDDFKSTYQDNVLFTRRYVGNELDQKYQDKWIVALNRFIVHKLDLNDKVLVKIVPMEASLIRRLDKIAGKMTPATEKEYRAEMTKLERDTVADMKDMLGGDRNWQEFRKFKKLFYEENARR